MSRCGYRNRSEVKVIAEEFRRPISSIPNTFWVTGCSLDDSLLAAPLLDEGAERQVYLPQGRWLDFWRGEEYHGPVYLAYRAPLEILVYGVRERETAYYDEAEKEFRVTVNGKEIVRCRHREIFSKSTRGWHIDGDPSDARRLIVRFAAAKPVLIAIHQ